jgi:elongation factor 1 alpha-like protein
VLDETEGERARGVTMDVGVTHFETDSVRFTLLDAPGHRDFIPKMIDGATQADCGVLVVNSIAGEFETGLDKGGQTREHARLLRSVGVYELIVACNKMDDGGWSQARYEEIVATMSTFLATCGFKVDKKVTFVPTSGLTGANLKQSGSEVAGADVAGWYEGHTLLEALDSLADKVRTDGAGSAAALAGGPLRLCVTDIYKSQALNGLAISGKIESGAVAVGDSVVALPGPAEDHANVKGILRHNKPVTAAVAGDTVELGISGVEEIGFAVAGCVLCHPDAQIAQARKLRATVFAFDTLETPMTKGFPVRIHGRANDTCQLTMHLAF